MSDATRRPMRPRALIDMAREGDMLSPHARIRHVHSLAPARVALTEIQVGRVFLERWPIRHIHPDHDWRADHYISNAPATFVVRDAIVHSSAGLLRVGDEIVAETIVFSDPAVHGYTNVAGGLLLHFCKTGFLPGSHMTTLYGLAGNYYHALIDGVARLSMVPPHLLAGARSLLHAGTGPQMFALSHAGLGQTLRPRAVAHDEAFHVEELILPLSVHHDGRFHPCLNGFFDTISACVPDNGPDPPRRIYIDRRGSPSRPLLNEAEVIEHVRPLGFVPVRPETLSLPDQLRLFRGAEAIVAPHGAGLTNLGWCRPACAVLELHMDAYAHWFYRNLAGLRSLDYDCVFGRSIDPWPEDTGRTQALRWVISAQHVAAGAGAMLSRGRCRS